LITLSTACGGGGGFPDARVKEDAPPPTGTFKLAWSLVDANNAAITCDRVTGQVVVATLRSTDIVGGMTEVFTCATGMGESQGIAPGNYSIDFELDGGTGSGMTLASVPKMDNVQITSGSSTALPPIVFQVDATGNLAAHIAAVKAGTTSNCAAVAAGGAAITSMTLTMTEVSGGACETGVMFAIGPSTMGGTATTSFMVDCGAPMDLGCIETDQTVTATGMPSGNYLVHVRGDVGAAECWKNDDQLAVPAAGGTKTTTLNLGFQASTPGCS
jgi:hypothetical protein